MATTKHYKNLVNAAKNKCLKYKDMKYLRDMYEENWVRMMNDVGNKRYIDREKEINKAEVDAMIRLHIYVFEPLMDEDEDKKCVGGGGERSLLDFMVNKGLTMYASCDIVDNIDSNN